MVVIGTFHVPALPTEVANRNPRFVDVHDMFVRSIQWEYLPREYMSQHSVALRVAWRSHALNLLPNETQPLLHDPS